MRIFALETQIEPKDSNMWNTLGSAYYQLGNWKEAIAALEESVKLVHDIGGDQDCLGDDYPFLAMAHWQRGEKELARKYYEQGVRWIKTHSSMTDVPRQARDACRREHHAYQAQAAQLLGIKDQPRRQEKEKPHAKAPGR